LSGKHTSRRAYLAAVVAATTFAVLTGAALLSYLNVEARAFASATAHTRRVARNEATLVHYWLDQRVSDAEIMGEVSRVRTEFPKYLAGDENAKVWLDERLEAERKTRGYLNVSLYKVDGTLALTFGGKNRGLETEFSKTAASVASPASKTVMTSHAAVSGGYHVTWFTPLVVSDASTEPTVTGVIMYEADLQEYLQSVMEPEQEAWPTVIEMQVPGNDHTFSAVSSKGFRFEPVADVAGGVDRVVKSTVPLPWKGASISAVVRDADIRSGLGWARQSMRLADGLLFVVFALFVWAYFMAERNRLAAIAAREAISDALATQDRFLEHISHDLRTPLNSIIGFSSLLMRGLPGDVNPEQKRQLSMIESSGRHLLALITDVLDLSKTKAGNEEVRPEWILASEPVEFVSEVLAPAVAEKRLNWNIDVPADLEIRTDRRLLERILLSLGSNAVKFTLDGFVTMSAAALGQDEVAFTVRDSGSGINPESLGYIMQEFRQLELPGMVKPDGFGLGLSICNTTARLLGGRIEVSSKPGVGSAFTLVLPRNVTALQ